MSILIHGAGAVGLYLAAQLSLSGQRVTLKGRAGTVRASTEGTIGVIRGGHRTPAPGVEVIDDVAGHEFDTAIITTKAWQVEQVAAEIAPALRPGGRVITIQNGVDAPAHAAAHVPSEAVYAGTILVIARRTDTLTAEVLGAEGDITLGSLEHPEPDAEADQLIEALVGAGLTARWATDIRTALWRKLTLIASYGGVGALADATVGGTRSAPQTRALVERAMREVIAVGNAAGAQLGEDDLRRAMHAYEHLFEADATASMQRDLREGRPSELADQNGAIVAHAARLGIPVPVHETIWAAQLPRELTARGELP